MGQTLFKRNTLFLSGIAIRQNKILPPAVRTNWLQSEDSAAFATKPRPSERHAEMQTQRVLHIEVQRQNFTARTGKSIRRS